MRKLLAELRAFFIDEGAEIFDRTWNWIQRLFGYSPELTQREEELDRTDAEIERKVLLVYRLNPIINPNPSHYGLDKEGNLIDRNGNVVPTSRNVSTWLIWELPTPQKKEHNRLLPFRWFGLLTSFEKCSALADWQFSTGEVWSTLCTCQDIAN